MDFTKRKHTVVVENNTVAKKWYYNKFVDLLTRLGLSLQDVFNLSDFGDIVASLEEAYDKQNERIAVLENALLSVTKSVTRLQEQLGLMVPYIGNNLNKSSSGMEGFEKMEKLNDKW